MIALRRVALVLVVAVTATACQTVRDTDGSPTAPSSPRAPTAPAPDQIEFRVNGNVQTVVVKTSDTFNGLQVIQTGLPYFTTIESTSASVFLSIDAMTLLSNSTSLFGSYVQVQIFVNGLVFREAFDNSSLLPHATASGTYRR